MLGFHFSPEVGIQFTHATGALDSKSVGSFQVQRHAYFQTAGTRILLSPVADTTVAEPAPVAGIIVQNFGEKKKT